MSKKELDCNLKGWNRKPVVRQMYADWYGLIGNWAKSGKILEIGGGFGNYKSAHPETVSIDIIDGAQVDAIADAHCLPFKSASFDSLIMVDVLHHLRQPATFFFEASRVLRSGGRLCMVEPFITPFSWLVYRFFHKEKLLLHLSDNACFPMGVTDIPFDGNLGTVNILFGKKAHEFMQIAHGLTLLRFEPFSYFAYPLSGGFSGPQLLPTEVLKRVYKWETMLAPFKKILASRALIVLEKPTDNR